MPIPDSTLHEQWCQHRDADAIAELVRRHSAMVYSTCLRVLRNASAAEEAAQECFIEFFRLPTPIRPSVGGWLHTVAARRAADHLKMEIRRKTREADYAIQIPQSIMPLWDDVSAHIDAAIANLEDEIRLPLVLRFLDGKSQPEIARELGLSVATVKRRVNQGVHRIREDLRGKGIAVTAAALAAMLEEVPALPLPNAVVAELGKRGLSGSAAWTGTTGATALKSAATIGGIIAVKKAAIAAAVIVIAGLVFVQQQYFRPSPSVPPPSHEAPVAPIATPEPLQAVVAEARPEATLVADMGPSITGVVLDHEDNPVEGATVEMRRIVGDKADPRVHIESAVDGSFAFKNVAPSKRVDVTAKKDGMVWMPDQNGMHELTEAGLSEVIVRLCPEAIIEGRVVDLSGLPVTNKEVSAALDRNETILTDSAGQFRIGGLEPGTHGLSVIPKKQYTAATVDVAVTLKPGEKRTGVEIVYWGDDYTVSGRVVNDKGEPLKDVMVQLIGVDGPNPRQDYTDDEGKFRLVRIPEGRYSTFVQHHVHGSTWGQAAAGDDNIEFVLKAIKPSGLTGRVVAAETDEAITKFDIQVTDWSVDKLHDSGFGFFDSIENENGEFYKNKISQSRVTVIVRAPGREMKYVKVDLSQGPPDELVVRLERSAIAKGVVVTSAGAPVAGAYMLLSAFPHSLVARLSEGDGLWTDWLERNKVARSKEDGTFEIDSLIPELRVITAYHPGHGFGSVGASKATVANTPLRITLSEGGSIAGTVTVAGVPIKGVGVSIASSGPFGENSMGGAGTDENGAYQMNGVPAGTWTVALTVPSGRAPTPMNFLNGRRIDREGVVVADGQVTALDFDVPADGVSIEGTVLLDGQPAAKGQVIVFLDGTDSDSDQTLLEAGRYRFDNLPEGPVRIVARGGLDESNQHSKTRSVTLEAAQTNEIDFELAGGVTLQGTVRGLRQEEGQVTIRMLEGAVKKGEMDPFQEMRQVRAQTLAEPGGAYTIEGMEPGTYTLFIEASAMDETGAFISSRDTQAIIEVGGADGDVMQLDPLVK